MNQSSFESEGESNSDPSSTQGESNPLDAVLEATLSQGQRTIKPEERDRLREILLNAEREGATIDRWSAALVRGLLEMRMPQVVLQTKSLDHMSLVIASTLCSDPASKQRLVELHTQLMENRP